MAVVHPTRRVGLLASLTLSESEGGDKAVILHASVGITRPDWDLAARLVAVSNEKYGYDQTIDQYEGQPVLELIPETVLAWTRLANATRWTISQ